MFVEQPRHISHFISIFEETWRRKAGAELAGIHLSGTCIHHGGREDGHDSGGRVEDALLQHGRVLFHPPVQRHVVILGPAAQRVEQQDGPAVAALNQAFVGVLHQESVTVVHRVSELERKHGI